MTRTADNRNLARERSLARARTRFLAVIPEDRAAHWRSKWSHDDAALYRTTPADLPALRELRRRAYGG